MPSVTIFGMVGTSEAIRRFRNDLRRVVANIRALDLRLADVDVYLLREADPPDTTNITVHIHGIGSETELDVQNALAQSVHDAIRAFHHTKEHLEKYHDVNRVCVTVYPLDPSEQGHVSTSMKRSRLELVSSKVKPL